MIRGDEYDPEKRNRRTTRGRKVKILGGEVAEWSSVHVMALRWTLDPAQTLYHTRAKSDLFNHLVHTCAREEYWVQWEGGRYQRFPPSDPNAKLFLPFLARDALRLASTWNRGMEASEQRELAEEHGERWRRYARDQLNVVGIPLRVRWKIWLGGLRLWFGLSAELPPVA